MAVDFDGIWTVTYRLADCAPLAQGTVDAVGRALADALGAGTVRSVVATL